jgi:RNA polymerase sigma-70 factor (ECF subfamily)
VPTPEQIYEQTLVVRCQLGDEDAFRELFELYAGRLQLFVRRMISTDQTEDLLQEIWIAIFKGLPRLNEPAKFRPWAFRIARDRVFREFRKRRIPVEPIEDNQLAHIAPEENPLDRVDLEELQERLQTLSPPHREVLILYYLEELSYEEIARITSTSLGTVRSRIHYAKNTLRKNWYEKRST